MLVQKGSDFCSITRNKGINGRLCLQNRAETHASARLCVRCKEGELLTANLISRLTAEDQEKNATYYHSGSNAKDNVIGVCVLKHFSIE